MNRSDIVELYNIAPIDNIPSIVEHGILSYMLASKIGHISIAMDVIQDRRHNKRIPGAGCLHEYANLYFDAHNPMLSKRRDQNDVICVLRINKEIFNIPGAIVADRNASSGYARFYPVEKGIQALDGDLVFARYWVHQDDEIETWRHRSIKCAEVLVPERVDPKYIIGVYVANDTALKAVQALNLGLPLVKKNGMFF